MKGFSFWIIYNFNYSEEDIVHEDGSEMTPIALYAWCTRLMYHRRTKLNPLLTTVVVAGIENDEP